jgi:hypothetical protein
LLEKRPSGITGAQVVPHETGGRMSKKWMTWVLAAVLGVSVLVALTIGRPDPAATGGQTGSTAAGVRAPVTALPTVYEFTSDT